jgi:4a-hydroxytetrahydrobiopterin dehydratase
MWKEENNKLYRSFKFRNFSEALAFMVQVGLIAEKMDHHPEWKNVYNTLDIWLYTHSAGDKVTGKDHALAKAIDEIFRQYYLV